MGQKTYVPLSAENLRRHLRVPPHREPEFSRTLRQLERDGEIARIKGNRYILPREADLIPGRIRMNRAGKGFLQPDDSSLKEIAIAESATGTALHEDRVLVRRDVRRKNFRDGDTRPAPSSAFWNAAARKLSARCSKANSFCTSSPMTRAFRMTFM